MSSLPILLALLPAAPAPLQAVAFEGATVHSMVPGEAPRVATVLVRDGLVEAVGEELDLAEDVRRVDARGQHVVPGLVDAMVHHDPEHDALYVLAGITLARDMGNDIGRIFTVRERPARDALPGPALLVCGGVLDGAPPVTTEAVVVTSPEEVDDKLVRLVDLGIDFASFHLGIPEPAWRRTIELAHEHGLQVWGPVPRGLSLADAIEAGQDGLVGIDGFLPRGKRWDVVAKGELDAGVEACAGSNMALTPLLAGNAVAWLDPGDAPPELDLLSPAYAGAWRVELERRRAVLTDELREAGRKGLAAQRALVARLWDAGARIVPGSGAPNPWLLPGAALHDELARLVAVGVPPPEVLRLATRGACEALGIEGERGAIAPGLVADLVFVGGDPAQDLELLREPVRVVVRGHVLERADLDLLRKGLLELQARAREEEARPIEVEPPELPEGELVLSGHVRAYALGRAIAAERYAVVELAEGGTVYCSRQVALLGPGLPPSETHLWQTIEAGRVTSFRVAIHRRDQALVVKGLRVGGQFRIERRMNELHVDTSSVVDRVALVDAGSVTTALVAARELEPGPFSGLYFEDAEPAVGRWELAVDEKGTRVARGYAGPWAASFLPDGGVARMERFKGSGTIVWEAVLEPAGAQDAEPEEPTEPTEDDER